MDTQSLYCQFNQILADAIFCYSACASKDNRFEACVATMEMNDVSWNYGHQLQIILSGTFGICNCKVLLFIVMVVDEHWKGIPVAFLLFSAPSKTSKLQVATTSR
jgi:hypothetical protein